MSEDVRKDEEAKKPQSPPAELKQNPHDVTESNKKDLEHLRNPKKGLTRRLSGNSYADCCFNFRSFSASRISFLVSSTNALVSTSRGSFLDAWDDLTVLFPWECTLSSVDF